jgi:haloalkane dehalogenase
MNQAPISAADPYERKRVTVLDTEMAYVDTGSGDPIVFLHGNPTSSYLWRNVIPHLEGQGRCLAPDLVGMGQSGKNPAGSYRFVDHYRYLSAWFDAVGITENVILVVHDWGSALGFNWAYQRRDESRVQGIAYMEAVVRPITWDEWPERARDIFKAMRSPAGERIVLEKNVFVERILPASVLRGLTDEEMTVYRQPYLEPGESRRPTLTWPREIPIDGEPEDVVNIVDSYARWLAACLLPKLFINADPGSILTGPQREFCRTWANQEEVTIKGLHFIQEDSPDELGQAVAAFVTRVRQ